MAKRQTDSARKFHFGWRGPAVFILTSLGIISLTVLGIVHWTERQILTTDNWVELVAPLPKNDTVATALSNYSVNALFSGINVEQKVANALPPKADFLAPTLTTQLQATVTKSAKKIIQSDQFQTVWVAVNRGAHQKLMESARQTTPPPNQPTTKLNINLAALKSSLGSVLGGQASALLASGPTGQAKPSGESLGVKIKTSLDTFRKYVHAVDFLDATLGLATLVCLLGGIVLTYSRRRLIQIMGIATLVVGLLQLIGVKAVRPDILNQVQNASYRPAVGVVYDELVATFHRTAMVAVVLGALTFLIAFLTKTSILRQSRMLAKQLDAWQRGGLREQIQSLRRFVKQYRWPIMGGFILLMLILLAFVFNPDGQGLVRAFLVLILIIEFINLVAARPRRVPMKQAKAK